MSGQAKTSDYAARWQPVAAPSKSLVLLLGEQRHSNSGRWYYPFLANPAGTYEVYNALVDESHKVGAWSKPYRFSAQSGWALWCGAWNQKPTHNDRGMVWKLKVISTEQPNANYRWQPGYEILLTNDWPSDAAWGTQPPYSMAGITPFVGNRPHLEELRPFSYADGIWGINKLVMGGTHTDEADPPVVVVTSVPIASAQVAYSYVTATGETALSPPCDITVPAQPGINDIASVYQCNVLMDEETPMGAYGRYVYVRLSGGDWQRVVSPDCVKETPDSPEDYLFQPDLCRLHLLRVDPSKTHQPVAEPKSWLSPLQVAMIDQAGDIDVTEDQQISCPIVHRFWVNGQQTTFRRVGMPGKRYNVTVVQPPSGSPPRNWPVLLNHSAYTVMEGLHCETTSSYCSAGIAFSGWGSGSFGNRFINCRFSMRTTSYTLGIPTGTHITQGIRIDDKCAGAGGHTASECQFRECMFYASQTIYIRNPQSANNVFSYTHATSDSSAITSWPRFPDRRKCCVYAETASTQIEFKDDLYTDCSTGKIFITAGGNLLISGKIWLDQGCYALWECLTGADCKVKIGAGKLNLFTAQNAGQRIPLARNTSRMQAELELGEVQFQFNPSTPHEVVAWSHLANRTGLTFNGSRLVKHAYLYEPTPEQHEAELNRIFGRPVDGAPPLPDRPEYLTESVTSGEAVKNYFNSLRYQAKVARPNWK